MSEEIFDIVNERDEVIGQAPRQEVHARGLWHRAVHVLVFNARGEVFLQKRSLKKDIAAGKWDSSSSGHLDTGEAYDACAVREVREEIDRKASGGGGTDFTCIEPRLAELADAGERIAGVIVLTDLCGSQFDPGAVPSLWICTEDTKSTHGRTVRIEA